jgi:hypothetical protein
MIGVWLDFGVGTPKQCFIIKKVGARLRGMVCGIAVVTRPAGSTLGFVRSAQPVRR